VGLVFLTLLLAVAVGHLAGGRAGGLTGLSLSRTHLLVAAFVVQVLEPPASGVVPGAYPIALAVSATLMTQFVSRNVSVPGVPLAGVGLLLNAAVVLVNGAMPVSLDAAARAGIQVERLDLAADPRHEPLGDSTRLALLADITPAPLPGRPEVVSPGDVLLAAGVGLFVVSAMLPSHVARRRRGRRRRSVEVALTAETR
jgi:hypothetical protein